MISIKQFTDSELQTQISTLREDINHEQDNIDLDKNLLTQLQIELAVVVREQLHRVRSPSFILLNRTTK